VAFFYFLFLNSMMFSVVVQTYSKPAWTSFSASSVLVAVALVFVAGAVKAFIYQMLSL